VDNDGVMVRNSEPGADYQMAFFSREQGTAPQLVVNYDPPALTVSDVSHSSVSTTSLDIEWNSNLESSSFVEYGPDDGYGSVAGEDESVTYHSVGLTSLTPGTTYHYRVKSEDEYGRETVSGDYTVTTQSAAESSSSPTPREIVTSTPAPAAQPAAVQQSAAVSQQEAGDEGDSNLLQHGAARVWQEGEDGEEYLEAGGPEGTPRRGGGQSSGPDSEGESRSFWVTPVAVALELVIIVTFLTLVGVVGASVWLSKEKKGLLGKRPEKDGEEDKLRVEK